MLQCGRFGRSELRAVGRRLRVHRVAKGWSLKRLSDMSGISVAAIRKVELGKSNPGLLTILALLEALDKPVDRPMFDYVLDGTVRVAPSDGPAEGCKAGDAFHLLPQAHGAVQGGSAGARLILVDQATPA